MAKPKNRRRKLCESCLEHPSRDRSDRFALDELIRKEGYAIWRRKEGYQPLWIKDGQVLAQEAVLEAIDPDRVWGAEYAEKLYWEGLPSQIELEGEP